MSARIARALVGLIALGLLVPGLVTAIAAPASAERRSFSSTGDVQIEDQLVWGQSVGVNDLWVIGMPSTYPWTIDLAGSGVIADLDVDIDYLRHDHPDDLDLLLVGPGGQQVTLMSDTGGSVGVDGFSATFDDEAPGALGTASSDTAGSYRPTNLDPTVDWYSAPAPASTGATSLSVFDGTSPAGTWSLYVYDDTNQPNERAGQIYGWSLDIELATATSQPYPSEIEVSGLPTSVADVDVTLSDLGHAWPDDIDMMLVGPQGQQATILSDAGDGFAITGIDLVLDDEVATGLPDDEALTSGTFRPVNHDSDDTFPASAPVSTQASALSVFDGTDPNGTWRLFVTDDAAGDVGTLGGWSLSIDAVTPPAPSTTAPPTTAPPTGAPTVPTTPTVPADTTAPTASSTKPAQGAKGVDRGVDVKVRSAEALKASTVTVSSVVLKWKGSSSKVKAKVGYKAAKRMIVLDPTKALDRSTTYKVTVKTTVTDKAGNAWDAKPKAGAQPLTWTFTTR